MKLVLDPCRSLACAVLCLLLVACTEAPVPAESPLEHAEKHLDATYVCPMHPEVTSDLPGECPICGMDLVEQAPPAPDDAAGVELSPTAAASLGVRVAPARLGQLDRSVRTVGTVAYDERATVEVQVRTEGYVEALSVRAAGEAVRRGQRLFEVFSPRLAAAQREYLQLLASGDAALVSAAEARLAALGLTPAAVGSLRERGEVDARVAYHSPITGVVLALGVREGALAAPGASVITLADASRLWVIVDVPEAAAAAIATGAPAELVFPSLPGRLVASRVEERLPALEATTRTFQARIPLANPSSEFAAGMRVDVSIQSQPGPERVLVPLEAVIRTGAEDRVLVETRAGAFEARVVHVGDESGGLAEILHGLAAGERVVVSGQFMLDSETRVSSGLARFGEGHDHHAGRAP